MLSTIEVIKKDINATVNAGTGETWEMFKVPSWIVEGEIIDGYLSNGGALTGHATNYTTIDIFNVTDNVAMASRAADTATTDDITADTPWQLTVSTTVANKKFTSGDQIRARKVDSGTGMAITVPASVEGHFFMNGTYD